MSRIKAFLNGLTPASLIVYFQSFQTNIITNFTANICEKYPSSIWCRDSNPRLLEHESPPITTRPGLPPLPLFLGIILFYLQPSYFRLVLHSSYPLVALLSLYHYPNTLSNFFYNLSHSIILSFYFSFKTYETWARGNRRFSVRLLRISGILSRLVSSLAV